MELSGNGPCLKSAETSRIFHSVLYVSPVCVRKLRPKRQDWGRTFLRSARSEWRGHGTGARREEHAIPVVPGTHVDSIGAAKNLMRKLMACQDGNEVLALLAASGSAANFRHFTGGLYKIAKLREQKPRGDSARLDGDRLEWVIASVLKGGATEWNSIAVANVLKACAQINHPRRHELQCKAEEELCRPGRVMDNATTISALFALATLVPGESARLWINALESAIQNRPTSFADDGAMADVARHVADFDLGLVSSEHLGSLAWALTELECSPDTADALCNAAYARGLGSLPPVTLALVARAVAERSSVTSSGRALQALAEAILASRDSLQLPTRDIAMLFNAYAKLVRKVSDVEFRGDPSGAVPKWHGAIKALMGQETEVAEAADVLVDLLPDVVPHTNPQSLSSITSGLALLQRCPIQVMPLIERRALKLLPTMEFSRIAGLCWSFASLRYDSPRVMDAAASMMLRELDAAQRSMSDGQFAATVTLALHAYAVLDRFHSKAPLHLLQGLTKKLIEVMGSVPATSLGVAGWSLVVAKGAPGARGPATEALILEALKAWRAVVATEAASFGHSLLSMMHHVEVALRLEAPSMGMEAPTEYAAFFQSLYESGRLRSRGSAAWHAQIDVDEGQGMSSFQTQVFAAAQRLAPRAGWVLEHWNPDIFYPVDVALPGMRLAIEADGPTHFAINTRRPLGATLLKRRLLSQLGWTVVDVPFFEWDMRNPGSHAAVLKGKLEQAGVPVHSLAAVQHGKVRDAEEVVDTPPEVKEEKSKHTPDKAELHINTVSVAERARRLDLMRLQKGTLSKATVIAKHAARAAPVAAPEADADVDQSS